MPMFSAPAEPEHSFGQVLAAPQQTIGRERKSSTPVASLLLRRRTGGEVIAAASVAGPPDAEAESALIDGSETTLVS
jgi:hypothetical protein